MLKRALITGASRSLGKYLATRLVEDGWDVLGIGRTPIMASTDCRMKYLQADLSIDAAPSEIVSWCRDCPDLLVHNAAAYPSYDLVSSPNLRGIEGVFRVNAIVPYLLTLGLLERQEEGRFCSVVVINSEVIYHADNKSGIYAASKAASRVLATSLASACRSRNASVATLLLGPLADEKKLADLRDIATRRNIAESEIIQAYLRKSNPDLVIQRLIEFESCFLSLKYIINLAASANGMLCRLDGGSAGSLV
jgi:NAD(P)-dependent dehydrogenase (short-subunit alcohol dehydrogenase family)